MPDLTFLPYIIPTTFICYGIVVMIVVLYFRRQEQRLAEENNNNSSTTDGQSLLEKYLSLLPFQYTYMSLNKYGGNYLLLTTRLMSLGYICGVGIWNFTNHQWNNLFYFTHWNIIMISVYYCSVVISSIIGLIYHNKQINAKAMSMDSSFIAVEAPQPNMIELNYNNDQNYWSIHIKRLNFIIQILYEIAGASALFVTVVAFTLLNPKFEFWNVSDHFVTSMTFLCEISQNSLIIRWQHVILNMLWAIIYLIYIWPAVSMKNVTNWPYDFLDTSSGACFVRYLGLFIGNVLFYFLWYYLSRLKYEYIYIQNNNLKHVLYAHYRGTGVYKESLTIEESGSGSSTHGLTQYSQNRDYLGGSVHELTSQNSPVREHTV